MTRPTDTGGQAMLDQRASASVATLLHFTLARYMMRISLRRALIIAAVASAVTFVTLWLLGILFSHLDPFASVPYVLFWVVVVFVGMLTGLWLGYGPFTNGKE
jgi:hypothetical protein